MTGRLLIRADGGPAIGHGHVMRCLSLAQAWRARGGDATFVGRHDAFLRGVLAGARFNTVPLPSPHPDASDGELTRSLLRRGGYAAAVLDGYHFDHAYQHGLRAEGVPLLVIDDTAHLDRYDADVLLNQNLGSDALRYHAAGDPLLLLGARFALLRAEFAPWRGRERAFPPRAQRVLVTLGGSAQDERREKVLRAIGSLGLDVRAAAGASPDEVPGLMAWADVALTAAGSTCWELAFMGVPLIAFTLADNQGRNAAGLAAADAAIALGHLDEISDEQLAAELAALVGDAERRRAMSAAGRALIDGHGATRVAAAVAGDLA